MRVAAFQQTADPADDITLVAVGRRPDACDEPADGGLSRSAPPTRPPWRRLHRRGEVPGLAMEEAVAERQQCGEEPGRAVGIAAVPSAHQVSPLPTTRWTVLAGVATQRSSLPVRWISTPEGRPPGQLSMIA